VSSKRPLIALSLIYLLLIGAGYLLINHQASSELARQQQQGRVVERKLCTTLGRLAALKPPPGNPQTNPSRAYLQRQHDVLAQLGGDVGCR